MISNFRASCRTTLLPGMLLVFLQRPAWTSDWPQWRGPDRTGVACDIQLPKTMPATLPAPQWTAVVGDGYSSPVVHEGRVFVMGREADTYEVCLCFDARTGERLWQHKYVMAYKPPDPTAGSGPKSTPTVDGDRVYMFGAGGMFHCFDVKTGRVLWKHDCSTEYWRRETDADGFDAWTPPCGVASSPLVLGRRVIVSVGGKKAGAFTAFDRETGEILWSSLADRGSYGSPIVANLCNRQQIVGFTGRRMVGIDPQNGELLWEQPFVAEYEQTILTPVVWKDLVIVGGEKKPTMALRIELSGGRMRPVEAWKSANLRSYCNSPVVLGDSLVGFDTRRSAVVCLDLHTGAMNWTSQALGDYVNVVAAGGKLLALNGDGELYVFEANTKECVPLAKWEVSDMGMTWAHLAITDSCLYVKDKNRLMSYGLPQ